MEKNNSCLYFHKKPNGEIFYVGIGNKKRPYSKKDRNNWWHNITDKHGYVIEIISENLSWERACRKEVLNIRYFGRRDLGLGSLVNMTDGGDGSKGLKMSEESRKRISESHKGINTWMKGKKLSEETKEKMTKSRTGSKNFFFGKSHSIESLNKIATTKKGKNNSINHNSNISRAIRENWKKRLGK